MSLFTITRHAIRNYGSVLQTAATQYLLEDAGLRTEIIDYRQPGVVDSARSYLRTGTRDSVGLLKELAYIAVRSGDARRRGRVFERFLTDEISLTSKRYHSGGELDSEQSWSESDLFCVGSDQVWNLNYNLDNSPYYLSFAPDGATKFSFSSSIGMKELPADEEHRLVEALTSFKSVSVRESDAADYLNGLGIPAEQHVDPTLAISSDRWSSFAGASATSEPFLLVYQLNASPEVEEASMKIASHLGLKVVRLEYWKNLRGRSATKVILPDVREFVAYFRDASFVVTDSFHGAAFSTNFDVPFVPIAPAKYASRISSLLAATSGEHRLVANSRDALDVVRHDSTRPSAQQWLETERERAMSYLRSAVSEAAVD